MTKENTSQKKVIKLNSRRARIILRAIAVIITVLVILFIATETLGIASVSGIKDSIKNFFITLTPGGGYPYKINSSSVKDISVLNGNLFVLTDDKTLSLDSTAKEVKEIQHTYSTPAMSTRAGRAVIYNRNGNRYRVENRTDVLFTGETKDSERIITAAIGKKGNLALATVCDSATSQLTVYNNTYKTEVFKWKCAYYSVVSVDLSPDGKCAAVSVLGASDGEIYSKVYIFDFAYAEPTAEFEYPGTAIIEVRFVSNNNLVAVGDNLISFIKGLDKCENTKFNTSTLSNYTFSENGDTVLVLSEHGSTNSQLLTCYSSSFNKNFEEKYTSSVRSVFMADGKVDVLLDDKVIVYRANGNKSDEYPADSTAISVWNLGNKTYVYQIGEIVKCSK